MLLIWGRVLRLSLAVTAVADVLAGSALALFATGALTPSFVDLARVLLLVLAALCVYHGGMALNDWADRESDARERPERPIPSGAVAAHSVLLVGLLGLFLGPALAALVSPSAGLWLAGVAACAALYDLAGRGPWRGPLLLALCRAGNLMMPLVAFGALGADPLGHSAAPLAYGAYVFVVSRLGRLEDAEEALVSDAQPRRLIATLALLLLLVVCLPLSSATPLGRWLALSLTAPAAFSLWRSSRAVRAWTRADVERHMGLALRRFLIFTAALAILPGTPANLALAALILCGYPLAQTLRDVFPPS